MSDLQKHFDNLISCVSGWSEQPLVWSRVLIAEETDIKHGPVTRIPRSALFTFAEYAPRFDEHLDAGHSWINMNAAGILGDTLLIVIELPSYANTIPRDKVSVNFSGPRIMDGKTQWDAAGNIAIVD